ncbi:hypothetical protein Bhyg_01800 [Pseudolycoriella hygida]|uniref:Uncharacterized protein n=1 Tax=Pseudolycoriella hygida TaxID=35572 RepID=A0A9Q0NAY9_9DIPT|nr:hypothetical protein Bhyg_01800 [Pseudolycoriella hygida]
MSDLIKSMNLTQSQSSSTKRKKRALQTDEKVHVGMDEPVLLSKRLKMKVVKPIVKRGSKRSTTLTKWPSFNGVTVQYSPKIWDIFERFQKFSNRKILSKSTSSLLDHGIKVVENISQKNSFVPEKNNVPEDDSKYKIKEELLPLDSSNTRAEDLDEASIGGDTKRRCVEVVDYDEKLQSDDRFIAKAPSAFKPKCLNFDDIEN